jgi:SAM-dependent methyltransferase
MYRELAMWWPLISAPEEYIEEAAGYKERILAASERPVEHVLELGSGGGNNASHMKDAYEMTLVDLSPDMLAVSRALNPDCEHIEGDMRTVRLDRRFDAVFVHDAIDYITTEEDLRATIETVSIHCEEGGAVLLAPDFVAETFELRTETGGHDGDGRSLRWLQWTHPPDQQSTTYYDDFAYLLREGDRVWVEHDRHVCGLFSKDVWLALLDEAGIDATWASITFSDDSRSESFVGVKRQTER